MWFGLLLLTYLIALIYALRLSRNAEVGPVGEQSYRFADYNICLLYTSPSQRDRTRARMPSSA